MVYKLILALCVVCTSTPVHADRCRTGVCDVRVVENVRFIDEFDVVQKRVEFDSDYFLGLNGYYDVVDELRTQRYAERQAIAGQQQAQLNQQQAQINQLIALLTSRAIDGVKTATPAVSPADPVTPVPLPVAPAPVVPAPITPTVPTPPLLPTYNNIPQEASALDIKVFRIFTNECGKCHNDNKAKGGLSLVSIDPDGEYLNNLSLAKRVLVYDHSAGIGLKDRGKKLMPLGGPPLSDQDIELLRLWMVEKAEKIKKEEG